MKRILTALVFMCMGIIAQAQESFPINGVRDIRSGLYAFTNATIIQNENTKIEKGVLIIKMGKIVAVGANLTVPAEAIVVGSALVRWNHSGSASVRLVRRQPSSQARPTKPT
jgi:imidazolonepropionase-like amidohydrolase